MVDKSVREKQLQSLITRPGGLSELGQIRAELLAKAGKTLKIPSSAVVQDIIWLEYPDEGNLRQHFVDIP